MNIFFLDDDPVKCAKMLVDNHVRKMGLEHVQMLCTAHHVLDGQPIQTMTKNGHRRNTYHLDNVYGNMIYKAAYINHPMTQWVRESVDNYIFTMEYTKAIFAEYRHRFEGYHKTMHTLEILKSMIVPRNIKNIGLTTPPLCMPDKYKGDTFIGTYVSYRNYYIHEKIIEKNLGSWTKREIPSWVKTYIQGNNSCPPMITDVQRVSINSKKSTPSLIEKPPVRNLVQTVENYLQWT